jgi:hypothetical protein
MMVSPRKWRSGNWKTMPTTAASWLVEVAARGWPARCRLTEMLPEVGVVNPATICNKSNAQIPNLASTSVVFSGFFVVCYSTALIVLR